MHNDLSKDQFSQHLEANFAKLRTALLRGFDECAAGVPGEDTEGHIIVAISSIMLLVDSVISDDAAVDMVGIARALLDGRHTPQRKPRQ
jgi:hypothetical protein